MSAPTQVVLLILLITALVLTWLGVHGMASSPGADLLGISLLAAGMLVLTWVATRAARDLESYWSSSLGRRIAARLGGGMGFLSRYALVLSGCLLGAIVLLLKDLPWAQPWGVLIPWSAAMVLVVLGADPARRTLLPELWQRGIEVVKARRGEIIGVIGLTALAVLVRCVNLGSIPYTMHGDEGEMGLRARDAVAGVLRDPFTTAWADHPTLWFFLQGASLQLFGDDLSGLRMIPAIAGALTVPVLYIYARIAHGRGTAVIAASLLLTYHFHVHFSRIGLNVVVDPLMMVLAIGALIYGLHRHSPTAFALSGILIGLAQYFYFSSRLIPIVAVGILFLVFLVDRTHRGSAAELGLLVLGFVVATAPMIQHYASSPVTFFGKLAQRSVFDQAHLANLQADGQGPLAALLGHAYRSVAYFIAIPERGQFYNSQIPILNHGMEILFLVGLAWVVAHWRKADSLALLLWVGGIALFGGILVWQEQESQRYLIGAPAYCLLMALGLNMIISLLTQIRALPGRIGSTVAAIAVLTLMVWNAYFYFRIYSPRFSYARTIDTTQIGRQLGASGGGDFVYMLTAPAFYLNHGTIQFLAHSPAGMDINTPLVSIADLPLPPADLHPFFVFVPQRLPELEVVRQRYPHGTTQEFRTFDSGGQVLLYAYDPAE